MIQEIKAGNQEIIAQLYKQYREEFFCWAKYRFSIDKDDAKDIFQECLLDFYLAIMEGRLKEINVTIKTYLFSCCKNKIYNLKKYKERNVDLEILGELGLPDKVADDSGFNSEIVNLAISQLPPKYQKLISLYYLQENCLEAISHKLDFKNVNVTKKTKSTCMKILGEKVREIELKFKNEYAII